MRPFDMKNRSAFGAVAYPQNGFLVSNVSDVVVRLSVAIPLFGRAGKLDI